MVAKDVRRSRRRHMLGFTGVALFGSVLVLSMLVGGSGAQKGGKRMGWFTTDIRSLLKTRNKGPIEIAGKGLPAYGLAVIALSDPRFNGMMSDFFGDDPPELVKIAAPTSVFLINGSNKALVDMILHMTFGRLTGRWIRTNLARYSCPP